MNLLSTISEAKPAACNNYGFGLYCKENLIVMMVEAECYLPKRCKEDGLISSHTVSPGDWTGVGFFGGKVRVAIINSVDDNRGSVLVGGNTKKIRAFIYGYDGEGKRADATKPIAITERQSLSLVTKKGKPRREVFIYSSQY